MTVRARKVLETRRPARPFLQARTARQCAHHRGCRGRPEPRAGDRPRLSGDDRDSRRPPGLCRRPQPVLRGSGGAASRRDRGGPHRRRSVRGRSVLLRLLHASLVAPEGQVPTEVVPGVTGMSGAWTRAGAPITWGDDVLTVCPARCRGGADAPAVRHRCRRGHEARTQPAEGPRGARRRGPAGARDLCRARHHGGASRSCPLPDKPDDSTRPTSR